MALEIVYSKKLKISLDLILAYLENKWSSNVAKNFLGIFTERVESLSNFPNSGIRTNNDASIRKIVITKHNVLYYELKNNQLLQLNIFSAKQNPAKNKYE